MTEAAPAAPESTGTPIEHGNQAPNPAETGNPAKQPEETTQGQPPKGEDRKSIDDIIKGAHEKAEAKAAEKDGDRAKEPTKAKEDAPKPEKKAEAKPDDKAKEPDKEAAKAPERGEDGKFVAKDKPQEGQSPAQEPADASQQRPPHHEPPSRFDDAAKAEWDKAPESIKGATHRVMRELENGIQKYKADAEAFGELKEFDALAKEHGTTIKNALQQYHNLDKALKSQDVQQKLGALQHVFQYAGINPREWAAKIMGQTPDQVGAEQHQQITQLNQRMSQLSRENNSLKTQLAEHQQKEVTRIGEGFPRFDELRSKMGRLVQSGLVDGDDEQTIVRNAYELADRLYPSASNGALNGAHTATNQEPLTPAPQPEPANPAGAKSISGAPASGSDPTIPAKRKGQNVSIDDAIKRASARLAS